MFPLGPGSSNMHFLLFSFSFLHYMALIAIESVIYFTALSAMAALESKFRCQAQSITLRYQISIDDWQFNFAAQQSLIQRSTLGSEAADLAQWNVL